MTSGTANVPRYRFGFVLTTAAGNQTRYLNLRKYAERDPEVECIWAPISHYLDPDPFRHLPNPMRTRMIVACQARPVMRQLSRLDAVMFHAFEPYAWAAARSLLHRRPRIVWSQDNPPQAADVDHPQTLYGEDHARSGWRARLRFALDRWCAARTALFLPFSRWAADIWIQECGIPEDYVEPIHVGLDLELWNHVPKTIDPPETASHRPIILFVGGDFERKGGPLLVDVFCRHFQTSAELHLVTARPPQGLPGDIRVYTGLGANSPRLRQLYAESDLFVLPTRADMSSWVALEAMATGRPVVISGTGGIGELIDDGKTGFLVAPDDGQALRQCISSLLENGPLRRQMGEAGRRRVEERYNAARNVPRILERMKSTVEHSHGVLRN